MELSLVIPSFNEKDNVQNLVQQIHQALADTNIDYEIFFVDDSTDETPQRLEKMAALDQRVRYYHRENGKGLGTAVVEGIHQTESEWIIVMDADLQHPPELLPTMVERLKAGIDIVIPSRFVEGGSDGGLVGVRKLISFGARSIGRLLLKRLRPISDCTSGFFGFKRTVVQGVKLQPLGWKILIEILMKANYRTVHEIPYQFKARDAGESKMSIREQWNYLIHLWKLMWQSEEDRRFPLFAMIGFSGVWVNLGLMAGFIYLLGMNHVLASVLASLMAMVNNYIWNDALTWRDAKEKEHKPGWIRMLLFMAISAVSVALTTWIMRGLEMIGIQVLVGQTIGILISTIWSYQANRHLTWGGKKLSLPKPDRRVIVTRDRG